MVEIKLRKPGMPPPGNVRDVLKSVERNFSGFHRDREVRSMAVIGLAQVVGAVVAHVMRNEGEERAIKALQLIYAVALDTATKGDALLRNIEEERRAEREREEGR